MANSAPENMVLRTVYFPKALDNRLRDHAFRRQMSKGEYIRQVVESALDRLDAEGSAVVEALPTAPVGPGGTSALAPKTASPPKAAKGVVARPRIAQAS